jgi:subtilisin/minor extracellular protease Epr
MLTDEQEQRLKYEEGIVSVENDSMLYVLGKSTTEGTTPTQPIQQIPWGISRVNGDLTQDISTGIGIKVAILDSGVDLAHHDLKNNIKGGYNVLSPRTAANDYYGHGTHVAGTIAAINNSIGSVGISSKASLYSVKILDDTGIGFLSDLVGGIEWAIKNRMQVVNISLACNDSKLLHDAVIKATQAGITIVAAAGNNPQNPVSYPAAYMEVISVAATDYYNQASTFSPKGKIDVCAPGVGIYSTYKGDSYDTMDGTSMAAAHVTGTVTLILACPHKSDTNGDGKITPLEVKQRLKDTSHDLGLPGMDDVYGAGLVDAYNAVF